MIDSIYVGIPWKAGGGDFDGADCKGLAMLFLARECGFTGVVPGTPIADDLRHELAMRAFGDLRPERERGDVVFWRRIKTGKITHVSTYLGNGRYLNILAGCDSRIENGSALMARLGYVKAGALGLAEVEKLCAALAADGLGEVSTIVLLVLSVALSLASTFLMPKPNIGQLANQRGRYSDQALLTQRSSEIPLPDILGKVSVAGNAVYTSIPDKNLGVTNGAQTGVNVIVVLCGGPVQEIEASAINIRINGMSYDNYYFSNGSYVKGFKLNPTQNSAQAIAGTVGTDTFVPSLTLYHGDTDVTWPVDVRVSTERDAPLYGLNRCAYIFFRLFDTSKFSNFNIVATVKGRLFRSFTSSGFTSATATGESLAGADGAKVRFGLVYSDIISVASVTVNGTSYSLLTGTNQAGNVYGVNKEVGWIEFITAPAASATILVTYTYYPRTWSQNPAVQIAYLLTDTVRGKALDPSRLDWASFVVARDYYDAPVAWRNSHGVTNLARYTCNYVVDSRKTIQDHLRVILDSCYSYLFVSSGKFVLKARKAESSVFSFNTTNILADTFEVDSIDRSSRPNRIKLFMRPADTYNSETEVRRDDFVDQRGRGSLATDGVIEQTLQMPAVDSYGQAERLAETILRESVGMRSVVKFSTSIKGLALEPGDVIDITHSLRADWNGKLARIEQLGYDADDHLSLTCSEYVESAYI